MGVAARQSLWTDNSSHMTKFTLSDGTVEKYDITGEFTSQWCIDNEFYDDSSASKTWSKQIVKVEFGTSVTSIGNIAFSWNSICREVIIPDSVTIIETAAFSHCPALTSITIGSNITSIGNIAFYDIANKTMLFSTTMLKAGPGSDCIFGTVDEENYDLTNNALCYPILTIAKDKASVKGMNPHYWFMLAGISGEKTTKARITCTDGNLISYFFSNVGGSGGIE